MTIVYFRIDRRSGFARRWASTNQQTILHGGFPVAFEIYQQQRSRTYIIQHTIDLMITRYGRSVQLIDVQAPKRIYRPRPI